MKSNIQFEMSEKFADNIRDIFNDDYELAGYLLASKEVNLIKFEDLLGSKSERDSCWLKEVPLSQIWIQKVKSQPNKFEVIPMHMHSRRYGDKIESIDPYLSSRDKIVIKLVYYEIKAKAGIEAKKAILMHPRKGLEGKVMSPDLIDISCYEYEPKNELVKELRTQPLP